MLQIFLASPTRRLLLRFFAEIGPRVKLNCAGAPDLSGRICPQPLSNLAKKSADGVGEHWAVRQNPSPPAFRRVDAASRLAGQTAAVGMTVVESPPAQISTSALTQTARTGDE